MPDEPSEKLGKPRATRQKRIKPSPPTSLSPAVVPDTADPGDETQRNFRYQYSYGVILLVAAIAGKLPYIALWCEHHDDFLGECPDGKWDAFQIKTRKPELGAWTNNDAPFCEAIKRFVYLDGRFPGSINSFNFVSNTEFLDSTAKGTMPKSPVRLLLGIGAANDLSTLDVAFSVSFEKLRAHCGCEPTQLFGVLQRLKLTLGPDRGSFDTVLAYDHISTLQGWDSRPKREILSLRDQLIFKVYSASSLLIEDPSKHYCCVGSFDGQNPTLLAKRILVASIETYILEQVERPFRFLPGLSYYSGMSLSATRDTIEQKFEMGGIGDQLDITLQKAFSTEAHLMEIATSTPDAIENLLAQVTGFVGGVCGDASLEARQSAGGDPYGPRMLLQVLRTLRAVAQNEPRRIHGLEADHLMGIAALLTGECKIWWSERFQLRDAI